MKKEIDIEGMMCNHCVTKVSNTLKSIDGIKKVKVDLKKGKAIVEGNNINNDEIINNINNIDYKVTNIKDL